MNYQIFSIFFELSKIPILAKIAMFLSYPFTYGIIFILVVWSLFISKNKIYNFSLLFLSGFFSWVFTETLKNILKINRPFVTEQLIPIYRDTGYSFPSSHMAVFTALAVCMFLIDRRAGIFFSIIAILIGISRIVIGVHYPIDILGGLIVGLVISLIFTEIFKKI